MKLTTEYIIYLDGKEYASYQDKKLAKEKYEEAKLEHFNCWVKLHEIERTIIAEEFVEKSATIEHFVGKRINKNIFKFENKFHDSLAFSTIQDMVIAKIEDRGYFYRIYLAWEGADTIQDKGDFEKHIFKEGLPFSSLLEVITEKI